MQVVTKISNGRVWKRKRLRGSDHMILPSTRETTFKDRCLRPSMCT